MQQLSLFNFPVRKFHGSDYDPKHDEIRLTSQIEVIKKLMSDGVYRTLTEIREQTGYNEASISAQLRNLRKQIHGGHTVLKRVRGNRENGLFEYHLTLKSC